VSRLLKPGGFLILEGHLKSHTRLPIPKNITQFCMDQVRRAAQSISPPICARVRPRRHPRVPTGTGSSWQGGRVHSSRSSQATQPHRSSSRGLAPTLRGHGAMDASPTFRDPETQRG
jgi:hypothetical protein